jgi:hypothetical protein
MNKLRFVGTFLLVFALLLFMWEATRSADWYTQGLLACAGVVGPAIHGWVLDTHRPGQSLPVWVRGPNEVKASLQFDALSVGLVPLLALLAATPGLGIRRRAGLMLAGAAICFALHTSIVAMFPLLVFYKNAFTDVIGTFLGVVIFVGAPVMIWFTLAFRELQGSLPSLRRVSHASR